MSLSNSSIRWILLLNGLFCVASALALRSDELTLTFSIAGSWVCFLIWQIALYWRERESGLSLRVQPVIRLPHYFQGTVQGCHYVYLGLYYESIADYLPLIAFQLIVAYTTEMLLCWWRGRAWNVGFGPFPIIGSINLFLWFQPQYFYWQILLVVFAFCTKEFIRWDREGRSSHIFNPSAIALAVTALLLMASGSTTMTTGVNYILAYEVPPNFFEFMFLFGLLLQVFFATTLVTFGAVLAFSVIFYGSLLALGQPLLFFIFHINVFLGLNLLATDPATSPRSDFGKVLFGLSWGAAIWVCYVLLVFLELPSYYDKILTVPIVNLMVPLFERAGKRVVISFRYDRLVHIGLYVVLFSLILPRLKTTDDSIGYYLKDRIPDVVSFEGWKSLRLHREKKRFCDSYPRACEPWGFLEEWRHFSAFRKPLTR